MERMSLLLGFLFCSFYTLKSQVHQLPELSIPVSEIRSAIGIDEKGDFALVYKSDTLASYTSTNIGSVATFFDERIEIIGYTDSLLYRYNLSTESGVKSFSLPDTLPIYATAFVFEIKETRESKYDSTGREIYKAVERNGEKTITRNEGKGKEVLKIQADKWSFNYSQQQPDSSFYQNFTRDTNLTSWGYLSRRENGSRVNASCRSEPYNYNIHFSSEDSVYSFDLDVNAENDTNIFEKSSRYFKDIDSSYHCEDWVRKGSFGYGKSYRAQLKDSAYHYNSYSGKYTNVYNHKDSIDVSKSYDVAENLIYRSSMKMVNGDYGVEEILEKRDTFYHVINYYHQLYWDKDHITDLFPYYKQVYLDEDSAVIRVLDYSFEKQDEWPVLTITEGDSSWAESTDVGGDSKYAAGVAFCGGAISSFQVCEMNDSTFSSVGMINRKGQNSLKKYFEKNRAGFIGGVGVPPFYFIKN